MTKDEEEAISVSINEEYKSLIFNTRADTLLWCFYLFAYGWLFFEGGLSQFIDELFAVIPDPFSTFNKVGFSFGLAGLIGYRAASGNFGLSFNAAAVTYFYDANENKLKVVSRENRLSILTIILSIVSIGVTINFCALLVWLVVMQ